MRAGVRLNGHGIRTVPQILISRANRPRMTAVAAALLGLISSAQAEGPTPASPSAAAVSSASLGTVVISGSALRLDPLTQRAASLSGDRLTLGRGSTLGETLEGTPGISATQFGPNASRPVLRGQDGDRVQILSNAGASLDASSLSFDHAVPLDPLVVERVDVLRGPAALLFGPGGAGGVVNTSDNRIPRRPVDKTTGAFEARFGGAAAERGASALVETGAAGVALHADAFWRQTDDLGVPTYDRPQADGSTTRSRRVVNSASLARGGAFGGALQWDHGHFGASVDTYRNTYGVVAEDDVTIRMQRDRYTLAGEVRSPDGPLRALRAQASYSDYHHQEIEGDGAVGTTFKNRGTDYRFEASHAPWTVAGGPIDGVIGVQGETSRFSALGEEAFVPGTRTRKTALFALEHWRPTTAAQWSLGLRLERTGVDSDGDADGTGRFGDPMQRRYLTRNLSLGHVLSLSPAWQLQASLSRSERAPTSYELYASGVHAATGAFEQGDVNQRIERGHQLDAALQWKDGPSRAKAGLFWSRYSNYITLMRDPSLDTTDEADAAIPGYAFRGVRARLYGWEIEGAHRLWQSPDLGQVEAEAQLDGVRGDNLDSGEPLPRLAPVRATLALNWLNGGWTTRAEVRHARAQNRVPSDDAATPAWTMLNLSLSRRVATAGGDALLFVKLNNVGNALAYNASTIGTVRGLSPMAGRSLTAGVRVTF